MTKVCFKNLEKSELAKELVETRIEAIIEKFPDLKNGDLKVTLEMENSPLKAGPDLFKVKVFISKGRYKGVVVEKGDANLYVALADVVDHMLESLNRFGDRARVIERRKAREIARKALSNNEIEEETA